MIGVLLPGIAGCGRAISHSDQRSIMTTGERQSCQLSGPDGCALYTFHLVMPFPRCMIVSAMSAASRPGRYAVASRALTRRPWSEGWQLLRELEEQGTRRGWTSRGSKIRRSPIRFVHGFVHETRRDGVRRGRCRWSIRTLRRPLTEVSATTGDGPRRQRRPSYGS